LTRILKPSLRKDSNLQVIHALTEHHTPTANRYDNDATNKSEMMNLFGSGIIGRLKSQGDNLSNYNPVAQFTPKASGGEQENKIEGVLRESIMKNIN
jgi:hypothetical protein